MVLLCTTPLCCTSTAHLQSHTNPIDPQALGCIALAATAWPRAGLTQNTALLSPSAVEQLGLVGVPPPTLCVHACPTPSVHAASVVLTPVVVAPPGRGVHEQQPPQEQEQQQQQPPQQQAQQQALGDAESNDNALVLVLVQPTLSASVGSPLFTQGSKHAALLRMARCVLSIVYTHGHAVLFVHTCMAFAPPHVLNIW